MKTIRDLFGTMRVLMALCIGSVCFFGACSDDEEAEPLVIDPMNKVESDHKTLSGRGYTVDFPKNSPWELLERKDSVALTLYSIKGEKPDTFYTTQMYNKNYDEKAVSIFIRISKNQDKKENVEKITDLFETAYFPEDAGYKDFTKDNVTFAQHSAVKITALKWANPNYDMNIDEQFVEINPNSYVETYMFYDEGYKKIVQVMLIMPSDAKEKELEGMRKIANTLKMK